LLLATYDFLLTQVGSGLQPVESSGDDNIKEIEYDSRWMLRYG
jgi:hypothetical protein